MIRATTPTHKFILPFDYNTYVKKIAIAYVQNGRTILKKTESDVEVNGSTVSYKLTQEETKRFISGNVRVQVRVLTLNNEALASEQYTLPVTNVLNDEVL